MELFDLMQIGIVIFCTLLAAVLIAIIILIYLIRKKYHPSKANFLYLKDNEVIILDKEGAFKYKTEEVKIRFSPFAKKQEVAEDSLIINKGEKREPMSYPPFHH